MSLTTTEECALVQATIEEGKRIGGDEERAKWIGVANRAFAKTAEGWPDVDFRATETIRWLQHMLDEAAALEKPRFRVVAPTRQVDAGQEY